MRTLVWFRGKDLRLTDHVPLLEAARAGDLVPLFVVDPFFFAPERARALPNRMQFLVDSLAELARDLGAKGSRLLFVAGKSTDVVPFVAEAFRVDRVVAHRWSEPVGVERDRRVAAALARAKISFDLFEGETMAAPGEVLTGGGTPFAVFTPFARAFARVVTIERPRAAPRQLPPLPDVPASVGARLVDAPTVESIGLSRRSAILEGGAAAARARITRFLKGAASHYPSGRNALGEAGTSRLSQDLKFGTVSARTVWHLVGDALDPAEPKAKSTYQNELVWREFAYDVLRARPSMLEQPFRPAWQRFPWLSDERTWRAWATGTTGYPVVDASARQLLGEGFVHNRARMISASFLCKHLLTDYRRGEAHFLEHLTDGDWANNNLGWQWSAGCGADAQPYFRVFNPTGQGEKFDADGAYVRRYVPELAKLPSRWIHRPWEAPAAELAAAGVQIGRTYPAPVVDHVEARARFLAAAKEHLGGGKGKVGGLR